MNQRQKFWWTVGLLSATAGGIMNMGSNVGGMISPVLTPLIASHIGWERALQVAAVLAITSSLLWLWIKPPSTHD